jgi:hypothetical protein
MTITAPLRKLAHVQYSLASAPVRALEQLVARLFPDDAAVRVTLERQVDALDAAVARLLGTTETAPATDARPESSDPSRRVAANLPDLRADAEHRDDKSDKDGGQPGRDEQAEPSNHATQPSNPAHSVPVEERNRIAEELLDDLEEAPLVGELAEAPEDAKQQMADLRAKHLAEEFEAEQARPARPHDRSG